MGELFPPRIEMETQVPNGDEHKATAGLRVLCGAHGELTAARAETFRTSKGAGRDSEASVSGIVKCHFLGFWDPRA